jgi:hypothetical protein
MRIMPRRHKDPSSGANSTSDIAVTVNITAEFNMTVIWSQLTLWFNDFQGISSPSIVRVQSLAQSTQRLPWCRKPPWLVRWECTLPTVANACGGNSSYFFNLEHLNWTMHSQSPHLDTTPVIGNGWSLANCVHHQMRWRSGTFQLPHAKRTITIAAGATDPFQGVSSVASTSEGQNSIPSSSLHNSHIADIDQHMTSTPSAT